MQVLGAVLAGGASTRFGSPKALAELGGRRILDRVLDAVRAVRLAGSLDEPVDIGFAFGTPDGEAPFLGGNAGAEQGREP